MKSTESDVCYFKVGAVFNREPVELLEESTWTAWFFISANMCPMKIWNWSTSKNYADITDVTQVNKPFGRPTYICSLSQPSSTTEWMNVSVCNHTCWSVEQTSTWGWITFHDTDCCTLNTQTSPEEAIIYELVIPSVLRRCWLGDRKGIRPVKTEWWGAGMVICQERGADLHMAQLMPLPLTVSCFSKIQIGFALLVPAYPGSPGRRDVKRLCACVCVCGSITNQATN